jgi:hypothetical protein
MASPGEFSKDFPLDASVLAPGSSVKLTIGESTDADALAAIVKDDKFPSRNIELGHISFAADTGKGISFKTAATGGATIGFRSSASFQAGIGVYGTPADAIKALNLGDSPCLGITEAAGQRCLLMQWGYAVAGSISASHPLGVLGTVSFGVEAERDSIFAVLQRFDESQGAHAVISDTLASWRLPRHVEFTGGDVNLKPGTWVLAEANGSFALKLAASLGYDMSFAKQAKLLGVTHNLSAKLDTSLKATFGFSASGKYVLVVGRESADPARKVVRLKLCRQLKKGLNFGFNLSVGVTGNPNLPATSDDLIKATFGVHGLQVLKDLREWADPKTDIGQKLAGLAEKSGFDLLKSATGLDPAEFVKAKTIVADALDTWMKLPQKLSTMLWGFLDQQVGAGTTQSFKTFLTALSDPDPQKRSVALAKALENATFGDTPEGQFLEAIAERGLLALGSDLGTVSSLASQTLNILNGGIIAKLQSFINEKLNLEQIRKAVSDADFTNIEQWLQTRLGNFLDKIIGLTDLKEVQTAISALDHKVSDYYKTGLQALTKRYSVDFAATYQRATTDTALIDVNFDLSQPAAMALFTAVASQSNLDGLLTTPTQGVTLNQARLTHEIQRKGTVELHMPFFDFSRTHLNDVIVSLTAEDDGGRLLLYQINATDSVTVANRSASQLSVLASLRITAGQVPQLDPSGTIAYEMRQVKKDMRPLDLEHRTSPFVHTYLSRLFGSGDASLRTFYSDLDIALTAATHNQSNHLGDMAVSMQVSLPSSVLAGWFIERDPDQLRSDKMTLSRRLQTTWREVLPSLYFQELSNYESNAVAAPLLVWSCLPISTTILFEDHQIKQFNTDNDVFWNFPDVDLRRAVAQDPHTIAAVAGKLAGIQEQLREAGNGNVGSFAPTMAGHFVELALGADGDPRFKSLLFTESQMARGAAGALDDIANGLVDAVAAPTTAIRKLADYAAALADTFNNRLSSIYGGASQRALGPMVLVEASNALSAGGVSPAAMLKLYALATGHTFDLGTFVDGTMPSEKDVALTQTLVSVV